MSGQLSAEVKATAICGPTVVCPALLALVGPY